MTSSHTFSLNGRERVLQVILEASDPLPVVEVSRLAGIPMQQARNRVAELLRSGRIENIGSKAGGLYSLPGRKAVTNVPAPREVQWMKSDVYRGEKPLPIDPARLKFLDCPSRVGDQLIPWKRPMLITRVG